MASLRHSIVDDSNWPEVEFLNGHAALMGFLHLVRKGLSVLVFTWTTVVLLGGFVTNLKGSDFWCLTVIMLYQIFDAGVFDFLLKGSKKMSSNKTFRSWRLFGAAVTALRSLLKIEVEASLIAVVRMVLLAPLGFILVAVMFMHTFGKGIPLAISFFRLPEIHRDYNGREDNLEPALDVVYSLCLAQCVVFGLEMYNISHVARLGTAQRVTSFYSLDRGLVSEYLVDTVVRSMKDPSFASTTGRNLITYAVDLLMESESRARHSHLPGVRILGTILLQPGCAGQMVLLNHLMTGSVFFRCVILRLLETFGPTSPYSAEIREHAARIVAHVAGSIHLEEQFPGGRMIQCVSSLLDTFEECCCRPEGYERHSAIPKEYERDWLLEVHEREYLANNCRTLRAADSDSESPELDGDNHPLQDYTGLVVQGLRILQKLTANESNCRVIISNTERLLSKIMAPLISHQLHEDHHDEWSSVAEESLELMSRLMAAPGDTGSILRDEISGSGQAAIIATHILQCCKCGVLLKRQAVEILLDLSVDPPSIISGAISNNTTFMGLLLHILLLPDYCLTSHVFSVRDGNYHGKMQGSNHLAKKSSYITRLAGEKLQSTVLSQDEASANKSSMSLQSSVAAAVADLARTSVDSANNFTYRLHAVQILDDLCRFYTKGEYHKELKNAMADVMPKVLKEILCFGSTSAGIHAKAEANSDQVSAQHTDIEKGVVPQTIRQEDASSSQQQSADDEQHEGIRMQEAFMSLCAAIPDEWAHEFDDLAEKMSLEQGIPKKDFGSLVSYAEGHLEEQKKAQGSATEG